MLEFSQLCYISAYSFNQNYQLLRIFFFETGFVINNKQPLKKENSYAWLDYVVPDTIRVMEENI